MYDLDAFASSAPAAKLPFQDVVGTAHQKVMARMEKAWLE